MSMGNFIGRAAVPPIVMAATNPSARESDSVEPGSGMAHLTVVPTNFRPDRSESDGPEE